MCAEKVVKFRLLYVIEPSNETLLFEDLPEKKLMKLINADAIDYPKENGYTRLGVFNNITILLERYED